MTKQIAGAFLGTLAAGALIVAITKALGPIPLSISQVTTNKTSTFDVSGEGQITTTPDRAEINLGIQTNDTTVQAVQTKGNTVIKKITDDLTGMGIAKDDIKTVNYSLYPTYNYQTGSQQITGYSLTASLQIKVQDFSKINQVVDTATKDGANQVSNISFTLSDEKKKDVENQAREQAITEAKSKAESLSKLAGMKLGKIVNVMENTAGNNVIYPMAAKELSSAMGGATDGTRSGAPTNVEPGSTTFTMNVTLSYETL